MADVRALLKAKRQEARITHPYAQYNASDQLKCSICGTLVKHASAWEGHLGTKAHRTNVIRTREQEKQQQKQEAMDIDLEDDEVAGSASGSALQFEPTAKRKSPSDSSGTPLEKKRKIEDQQSKPKGFPDDFFSDPSRAPVLPSDDEDEEQDGNGAAGRIASGSQSTVDLEYERFQRELAGSAATDPTETYQRATIAVEPVAAPTQIAGFPPTAGAEVVEEAVPLTEEEIRQRNQQEERELIMDRLMEEERAQEDADTRVLLLKNKVEALRKKREAAKAQKAKGSS